MSAESLSRDPGDYFLSVHAGQQRTHRDISKADIAETIASGEFKPDPEPHIASFTKHFPGDDYPIRVVADTRDGEIVTVEWRYE